MKKIMLMAAAGIAMFAMAACSGHNCDKACGSDNNGKDVVYTGVIPAADCDGIRYTLLLDYDDDGREGDYKMVETYLKADTVSALGYKDIKSFSSEGDFTVGTQDGKNYLKLVEEHASPATSPVYFVIDSDSTITLANSNLEVSTEPGLNYTLTRGNK